METKQIKYLIEYNDDNHDPFCWLDTQYLGQDGYCDLGEFTQKILEIGKTITKPVEVEVIHIGVDSAFPDELEEKLWNYLDTIPDFDDKDIEILAKCRGSLENERQAWQEFYEKNKDKIEKVK